MEQIETRNILELLCLLDDVLLCKVLLEMEPNQMTVLGSVSGLFNLIFLLGTSNLKIFVTFYSIFLISEKMAGL
jgi:hypothetical protein